MNLPTCWFCGVTVPTTRVCPRCKQEFGECHSDPATHDCPGVQVSSPYGATPNQTEDHGNEKPALEAQYTCAFCSIKVDYSSRCEECQQQFCIDHARPEDHNCLSVMSKTPGSLAVNLPLLESETIGPGMDQKTLIPTPARPQQSQQRSRPQQVHETPPEEGPPLQSLPKPPPLPKLNISAAQTDVVVGRLLHACKECSEDPDLHSTIDPELGKFILTDPSILAMFKAFAKNPNLRVKFQESPLTRGLFIWFDALGEDLDALSEIGEEMKIPIAQLSLHELLHYYYAHLTDVATLLEARDTGGHPRVNPLEQWIQQEIGEESKGFIKITQEVLDDIARLTREAGERETIGWLVGTRDGKGNFELVSKDVPLLLGDGGTAFCSSRDFYDAMLPLSDSELNILGIFHSHPGNTLPKLSPEDIILHVNYTYRLSIFECLKRLDVKLSLIQRVNLAFCLSTFDHTHIRYLLDVIFAAIVFPPAIKPISDIVMNYTCPWEEIKRNIEGIIQKMGIVPTPVDLPLLPFVDVVISPDFRFIGAGGLSLDPDVEHPSELKQTPFFYHILIEDEIEKKE